MALRRFTAQSMAGHAPGLWAWRLPRVTPQAIRRAGLSLAAIAVVGLLLVNLSDPPRSTPESALSIAADSQPLPAATADGSAAKDHCRALLQAAAEKLKQVETFTAVLRKRERIGETLQELNVANVKVRRSPLAVYMRWREPEQGREVLWREDAHDQQMLVHPGGWRGKLVPLVKLDPKGEKALQYSRRPVTAMGLWSLQERLAEFVSDQLSHADVVAQSSDNAKLDNRECFLFRFTHTSPTKQATFREATIYIDKQLGLPVGFELYGWPKGGEADQNRLEESYAFTALVLNPPLAAAEFEAENPDYRFAAQ
jgi:hypothetical protein